LNISTLRRKLGLTLAPVVAAAGLTVGLAPTAGAAQLGTLSVTPPTGATDAVGNVAFVASAPCPETATNFIVSFSGAGAAAGTNAVGTSEIADQAGLPITAALGNTWNAWAGPAGVPLPLTGAATLTLQCTDLFGAEDLGTFVGTVTFAGGTYTADGPAATPTPTPATSPTPPPPESPPPPPAGSPPPTPEVSPTPTPEASPTPTPPVTTPTPTPPPTGGTGIPPLTGTPSQNITVTVPGEFAWSIDPNATVNMSTPTNQGSYLASTGNINQVSVYDTRPTAPAWTISGQVVDFTGGPTPLSGSYLGWAPSVATAGAGANAGSLVAPGFPTGDGLKTPSTLASATAGHTSAGIAKLAAGLNLHLPLDTPGGTYNTVLTITAVA
jgi:hypothetical protein